MFVIVKLNTFYNWCLSIQFTYNKKLKRRSYTYLIAQIIAIVPMSNTIVFFFKKYKNILNINLEVKLQ